MRGSAIRPSIAAASRSCCKTTGGLRYSDKDKESVPFSAVFLSDSKQDVDWNSFSDREFRAGIRAYFEKNFPAHLKGLQRRVTPAEMKDWFAGLARKGWTAPAWPKKYGGMELEPAKQLIYIEERERAGVPRTSEHGVAMLAPLLMQFGTEAQRQKYLPRILTNEDVWCQGYSEPNAGSDLASLQTEAVLDGDHWVINGSKIWTSGADLANKMFLLVRTARGKKKQEGISFLLIDDLKTPGLTIRPLEMINGVTELCQEYFENVRVPKENIVGEVNEGWTIAKSLLGFERLNSGSPRRPQAPLKSLEKVARATGAWDDAEFQSKYVRAYLDLEDLELAVPALLRRRRQGRAARTGRVADEDLGRRDDAARQRTADGDGGRSRRGQRTAAVRRRRRAGDRAVLSHVPDDDRVRFERHPAQHHLAAGAGAAELGAA